MAVTRKMLKGMSIEDEKIELIIEAHSETVDALKAERDEYKTKAEKLPSVQEELDDLKNSGGDWQTKYEKEHADFEAFKNEQTAKETKAAKTAAFNSLLKSINVNDKIADLIIKATNLDEYELDKDGKIKDEETLKNNIKTEYAGYIETTSASGTHTATPPGKTDDPIDLGSLSMKDYIAARSKT